MQVESHKCEVKCQEGRENERQQQVPVVLVTDARWRLITTTGPS